MKAKTIAVIFLALVVWQMGPAIQCPAQTRTLQINCTVHSPYEQFFVDILTLLCQRNDIELKIEQPPVGRSLLMVNQGRSDGDGPRIEGLSSIYPNLVRVAEPFGEFHFGAFARSPLVQISGWSDLADYNVAWVHGWKIFDEQVSSAKSIAKVKNKELLFGLLEAGRTDVVLLTRAAGMAVIDQLALEDVWFVEPPLAAAPNFLYLHKRHQDLAVILARSLRELKAEGVYDQLYEQTLGPYLPEERP